MKKREYSQEPGIDLETLKNVQVDQEPEVGSVQLETKSEPLLDLDSEKFAEIIAESADQIEVKDAKTGKKRPALLLHKIRDILPKELIASAVMHGIIAQELASHVDIENGRYICADTEDLQEGESVQDLVERWAEEEKSRERAVEILERAYAQEMTHRFEVLFPEGEYDRSLSELIPSAEDYAVIDAYEFQFAVAEHGAVNDLSRSDLLDAVRDRVNDTLDIYHVKLNDLLHETRGQWTGDIEQDLLTLQQAMFFGDHPFLANPNSESGKITYNGDIWEFRAQMETGIVNCTSAKWMPTLLKDIYAREGIQGNLDEIGSVSWVGHTAVGRRTSTGEYATFSPLELDRQWTPGLQAGSPDGLFFPANNFLRADFATSDHFSREVNAPAEEWTRQWLLQNGQEPQIGHEQAIAIDEGGDTMDIETFVSNQFGPAPEPGTHTIGSYSTDATTSTERNPGSRTESVGERPTIDLNTIYRMEGRIIHALSEFTASEAIVMLPEFHSNPEAKELLLDIIPRSVGNNPDSDDTAHRVLTTLAAARLSDRIHYLTTEKGTGQSAVEAFAPQVERAIFRGLQDAESIATLYYELDFVVDHANNHPELAKATVEENIRIASMPPSVFQGFYEALKIAEANGNLFNSYSVEALEVDLQDFINPTAEFIRTGPQDERNRRLFDKLVFYLSRSAVPDSDLSLEANRRFYFPEDTGSGGAFRFINKSGIIKFVNAFGMEGVPESQSEDVDFLLRTEVHQLRQQFTFSAIHSQKFEDAEDILEACNSETVNRIDPELRQLAVDFYEQEVGVLAEMMLSGREVDSLSIDDLAAGFGPLKGLPGYKEFINSEPVKKAVIAGYLNEPDLNGRMQYLSALAAIGMHFDGGEFPVLDSDRALVSRALDRERAAVLGLLTDDELLEALTDKEDRLEYGGSSRYGYGTLDDEQILRIYPRMMELE